MNPYEMVSYAAPSQPPNVFCFSGVQSHSPEWLKAGSAKGGNAPTVPCVERSNPLSSSVSVLHILHINLILPLVYILHNQSGFVLCWYLTETRSVVITYETDSH